MQEAQEMVRSGGVSIDFASSFSFPPENFLTLLTPDFFGDAKTLQYWGRGFLWEMCPFVGISGLALAAIGAFWCRLQVRRFALVMVVLLVVLALGNYTPLFDLLYQEVPGFNQFRAPCKFLFLASLFLALLAGAGLDELLRGACASRIFSVTVGALGVVLLTA